MLKKKIFVIFDDDNARHKIRTDKTKQERRQKNYRRIYVCKGRVQTKDRRQRKGTKERLSWWVTDMRKSILRNPCQTPTCTSDGSEIEEAIKCWLLHESFYFVFARGFWKEIFLIILHIIRLSSFLWIRVGLKSFPKKDVIYLWRKWSRLLEDAVRTPSAIIIFYIR